MTYRILDLFCGEGGAAQGYRWAGFDVVGVDINPQPNYPFEFHQADALDFLDAGGFVGFDAIHASPPCQALTPMSNRWRGTGGLADSRINLIPAVRERLESTGLPYVIENVQGSREFLIDPILLHGGHFNLRLWRPRLFECVPSIEPPPKAPRPKNVIAVYGMPSHENYFRWLWRRKDGTSLRAATLEEAREAMGMPWASWEGCQQAIPPRYTEFLGWSLIDYLKAQDKPTAASPQEAEHMDAEPHEED